MSTPSRTACPSSAGECSFMYRYILRESCSQFDSLPLTSLTIPLDQVPQRAPEAGERAHLRDEHPHAGRRVRHVPCGPRAVRRRDTDRGGRSGRHSRCGWQRACLRHGRDVATGAPQRECVVCTSASLSVALSLALSLALSPPHTHGAPVRVAAGLSSSRRTLTHLAAPTLSPYLTQSTVVVHGRRAQTVSARADGRAQCTAPES